MNLPPLPFSVILPFVLFSIALPQSLSAQSSELVFTDNFETGDFSHTENGFRWGSPNRTSIVRDDGCAVHINPSRCVEGNPGQWENGPGVPGRHSMRFRYPAMEAMSEQRFNLGGTYPELWIGFWLRVPINFIHENPTGSSDNNKFFALWTDGYTITNSARFIPEFRGDPSHSGSSRIRLGVGQSEGGSKPTEPMRWITYPEDQGRWMQIVFHVKMNNSLDDPNGRAVMHRRWEGEADFSTLVEVTDINWGVGPGGSLGWTAGYLMGWANSGYAATTEFLIDDFTVSTTSLLDLSASVTPLAPKNVRAQ